MENNVVGCAPDIASEDQYKHNICPLNVKKPSGLRASSKHSSERKEQMRCDHQILDPIVRSGEEITHLRKCEIEIVHF